MRTYVYSSITMYDGFDVERCSVVSIGPGSEDKAHVQDRQRGQQAGIDEGIIYRYGEMKGRRRRNIVNVAMRHQS